MNKIKAWLKSKSFLIVCAFVLIFVAFQNHLPYGFFQILRLLVCLTCGYYAYILWCQDRPWWGSVLAFSAFLFNPFFPIHMAKDSWQFIDLVLGIVLIIFIFIPQKERIH